MESDTKAPLCAAIFRLGIVMLQCVCAGEVFCGLQVNNKKVNVNFNLVQYGTVGTYEMSHSFLQYLPFLHKNDC